MFTWNTADTVDRYRPIEAFVITEATFVAKAGKLFGRYLVAAGLEMKLKNIRSISTITITVLVHVSAQQVVCSSSNDRGESKGSVANTESA